MIKNALTSLREPATKAACAFSLLAVLTVIVIQMNHSGGAVDATTAILLALAVALIFGLLAPIETGGVVADFDQTPRHRPDFLAYWDGRWVVMAPRVGGTGGPWDYGAAASRLEKYEFKVPVAGRCIVIPGDPGDPADRMATVFKGVDGEEDCDVKVLELQGSLRENPERALKGDPCNQDALRPRGDCAKG